MLRLLLFAALLVMAAACGGGSTKDATSTPEYVYVVDSANGDIEGNQVIVVDPASRSIVTTIPGTYSPDAVVDPSGGRIFVTRWSKPDLVDEYNTTDWARAGTFNVDKRYHEIITPPDADWLKLSPDRKLLYYLTYGTFPGGCGPCNSYIAAVNLQTGESALNMIVDKYSLGSIAVDPSKPLMYTTCSSSIGSRGGAAVVDLETGVLTPIPGAKDVWISIHDDQRHKWYLLSSMSLYIVDTTDAPNGLAPGLSIDLNPGGESTNEAATAALSPDGSRLYISVTTVADRLGTGRADEIWGFDTQSWKRVTRIKLDAPVFHFAVSLDGRTLYAVDYKAAALTFIDVESEEQRTMEGVGVYPAKVLVAPR